MKIRFLILLFMPFILSAQQQKPKADPEHYAYPLEEYYQPLHINVNAVLLKRKDGSGNFNLNNREEKALFNEFLDKIASTFVKFEKPKGDLSKCGNVTEFISDSKIRLDINIIEVKNAYYWNYLNGGGNPEKKNFKGFIPSDSWYIKPLDDSISKLNIPRAMNMYFTTNGERFDDLYRKKGEGYDLSGNMAGQYPNIMQLDKSSQVHIPNVYTKYILQRYWSPGHYNTTWSDTKGWWLAEAKGAAHEFGHNFGLGHSSEYYRSNDCDFTIMNQKGNSKKNWLPPNEIRKMHWNLSRSNLMQFVTPESAYGAVWKLDKDTEWNKPRRFYHNFELAANVSLIISDSIILPPQSYIKLNKNAKIIIRGKGKIVDAFGKEYKNFEKHRTAAIIKEN